MTNESQPAAVEEARRRLYELRREVAEWPNQYTIDQEFVDAVAAFQAAVEQAAEKKYAARIAVLERQAQIAQGRSLSLQRDLNEATGLLTRAEARAEELRAALNDGRRAMGAFLVSSTRSNDERAIEQMRDWLVSSRALSGTEGETDG